MQETGNNISSGKKILSIRLTSSGLSFSVATGSGHRQGAWHSFAFAHCESGSVDHVRGIIEDTPGMTGYFSVVRVYLDTVDTVFVPTEVLNEGNALDFMTGSGIYIGAGESVVVSGDIDGLSAVMKYDSPVADYLCEYYGARLSFYSPLHENLMLAKEMSFSDGGLLINVMPRNIYVTGFDAGNHLLLSEVYPYDNEADIIFYLHKLTVPQHAKKHSIRLFGPQAKAVCGVVRKYFKGASCV